LKGKGEGEEPFWADIALHEQISRAWKVKSAYYERALFGSTRGATAFWTSTATTTLVGWNGARPPPVYLSSSSAEIPRAKKAAGNLEEGPELAKRGFAWLELRVYLSSLA